MIDMKNLMELSETLVKEYYEEVDNELKTYTDAMEDLAKKIDGENDLDKKYELVLQWCNLLNESREFYDKAMNDNEFLMAFLKNKMGLK